MIIDILNSIEKSGFKLQSLARVGILSSKVISYREIYLRYCANRSIYPAKMDALGKTCSELNVSEIKVYRAKKIMEQPS